MSIHIAQFFGNLFISQGTVAVSGVPKGWTKPTHYGEALTEGEVVERILYSRRKRKKPRKIQVAGKQEAEIREEEGRQEEAKQEEAKQEEGRKEEGRPEENVEKMKTRTYVRYVEETMMMMTKRHRKGGLDVMKGVVGNGTTISV